MSEFVGKNPNSWLNSSWKFSRPHTIIGTSLSVLALYTIAILINQSALTLTSLEQCFVTWLACLCGNVYIVGLNQLEDIAIDKINKPHLPLAAAEFSPQIGWIIVGSCGLLSLTLAGLLGKYLFLTVAVSLLIGTAYSLPPIRLKRYPFWAALCIFTVRGVIVNLGIYLHFSKVVAGVEEIPAVIWLLTIFVLVFTVAIAIFKDVPDLEGDKEYKITTLTIILGKDRVFSLSRGVISFAYIGMILVAFFPVTGINPLLLALIHLVLLILLWLLSLKVDLQQKEEIKDFYQFIWKLFFIEYLLFPLVCL